MCFFQYSQCGICRFPCTAHATLVEECVDFTTQLLREQSPYSDKPAPNRDRFLRLHEEGRLEEGSTWFIHGENTTAQQTIDHEGDIFDLSWEIQPQRSCVRWAPKPRHWVCRSCRQIASTANAVQHEDVGETEPTVSGAPLRQPELHELYELAVDTKAQQIVDYADFDLPSESGEPR
jgi:hypothetical protein